MKPVSVSSSRMSGMHRSSIASDSENIPYHVAMPPRTECNCKTYENKSAHCTLDVSAIPRRMGNLNTFVYNTTVVNELKHGCNIKPDDKDCKCIPPPPKPPCKYLDCECLLKDIDACSRMRHKPFCPSYKHKHTCPVTKMNDEETLEAPPVVEEDVEHLPYGLPPVKVGQCPVPGRPCSGPEAMARLFKNTGPPLLPPVVNTTGKISCSKEYERIRSAMIEFIKEQEKPPFPCINKNNVDTEKTCCDVDQKMLKLFGKSCCAEHKLASMAMFKEKAELAASEKRNA